LLHLLRCLGRFLGFLIARAAKEPTNLDKEGEMKTTEQSEGGLKVEKLVVGAKAREDEFENEGIDVLDDRYIGLRQLARHLRDEVEWLREGNERLRSQNELLRQRLLAEVEQFL
jgi:hypothetical protein